MTTIEKVIILNRRESIKEFDEVVTVITENFEILDIFCPGTRKPTSKNRHSLGELSISELEYFKTKNSEKMSKLMRGKIIKSPSLDSKALETLLEISEKIYNQLYGQRLPYVYNFYNKILSYDKSIEPADYSRFLVSLYIDLVRKPIINACAVCKTKHNIRSFSLLKNGLLCDEHAETSDPDLSSGTLRDIINLFNIDGDNWMSYVPTTKSIKVINEILVSHIRNIEGIFI